MTEEKKKKTTNEKFIEVMDAVKSLAEQVAELKVKIDDHTYTPDAHNPAMMRRKEK